MIRIINCSKLGPPSRSRMARAYCSQLSAGMGLTKAMSSSTEQPSSWSNSISAMSIICAKESAYGEPLRTPRNRNAYQAADSRCATFRRRPFLGLAAFFVLRPRRRVLPRTWPVPAPWRSGLSTFLGRPALPSCVSAPPTTFDRFSQPLWPPSSCAQGCPT
jgi:hypothetical protein